jgi:hypothetical protein
LASRNVTAGRLSAITFIDPDYDTTSEENPQDIQVGERFIADVVRTLMRAPTWKHTALITPGTISQLRHVLVVDPEVDVVRVEPVEDRAVGRRDAERHAVGWRWSLTQYR